MLHIIKSVFLTSLLALLKYQIKVVFKANTYSTVDMISNYLKHNETIYYNHLLIYYVYQITRIKYFFINCFNKFKVNT